MHGPPDPGPSPAKLPAPVPLTQREYAIEAFPTPKAGELDITFMVAC